MVRWLIVAGITLCSLVAGARKFPKRRYSRPAASTGPAMTDVVKPVADQMANAVLPGAFMRGAERAVGAVGAEPRQGDEPVGAVKSPPPTCPASLATKGGVA
jgi:hypothetical protein